jgi:hypothetical protein
MQQRLRDQAIQQKNRPSVAPAEKVAPGTMPDESIRQRGLQDLSQRMRMKTNQHPPMPESLKDNPNIAWSPSKARWFDANTRDSFDKDGKPIK